MHSWLAVAAAAALAGPLLEPFTARDQPPADPPARPPASDTLRLRVGSPEVDGTVYRPHVGRVIRLRIDGDRTDTTAVWTNTLVIGDSAGRAVHRWHTVGWSAPPGGERNRFELFSTFDAKTLAPLGWHMKHGSGFEGQLRIADRQVTGRIRQPSEAEPSPHAVELPEAGFAAGAADLIPYAVGLREGLVLALPLWNPPGGQVTTEIWAVTGRDTVDLDGRRVPSWVMEHFAAGSGEAKGRIWFVDEPPYVVRWDLFAPDGVLITMIGEPARDG